MNRVLKYAWYQLIVIMAAILFAGASVGVIYTYWRGKEFSAVIPLCLFGLVHFYRVFFPLKAGEIAFDERDEIIKNKATIIAFTVLWYVFFLSCLLPLLVIGNGAIHVMYLGWTVFVAAILMRIVWSVAVIVMYRQGAHE